MSFYMISTYLASIYYPEILNFDLENLHKNYKFDATCQGSVPQAIFCFLESNSYEDCIKICIKIGGDCDTICCIAGGIAEAYYKYIPEYLITGMYNKLEDNEYLLNVIKQFKNIQK